MIRTWVLVVLMVAAAAGGAQAAFGPFEECKKSIYDGPLSSHTPIDYRISMDFGETVDGVSEYIAIKVKANYTENPTESRHIIVVHADKSVEIGSVFVKTHFGPSMVMDEHVAIWKACRDTAKQLLVIEFFAGFETGQTFVVSFDARFPARNDQKGFHQVETGLFRANFANKEARLIMPCFDDPKHKAYFYFSTEAGNESQLVGPILRVDQLESSQIEDITWRVRAENQQGLSELMSLDDLSFDLRTKK